MQPAQAVDFEIGVGVGQYGGLVDGRYYQSQFEHTEYLRTNPFSFGLSQEFGAYRGRVEFVHLGWVYNHAQFVSDATNYPGTGDTPVAHLDGSGFAAGVVFSLSHAVGNSPFYVEAGLFANKPKWGISVFRNDNGRHVCDIDIVDKWRAGGVVGFGYHANNIDVGIRYYGLDSSGGSDATPLYFGSVTTVMFKAYF